MNNLLWAWLWPLNLSQIKTAFNVLTPKGPKVRRATAVIVMMVLFETWALSIHHRVQLSPDIKFCLNLSRGHMNPDALFMVLPSLYIQSNRRHKQMMCQGAEKKTQKFWYSTHCPASLFLISFLTTFTFHFHTTGLPAAPLII